MKNKTIQIDVFLKLNNHLALTTRICTRAIIRCVGDYYIIRASKIWNTDIAKCFIPLFPLLFFLCFPALFFVFPLFSPFSTRIYYAYFYWTVSFDVFTIYLSQFYFFLPVSSLSAGLEAHPTTCDKDSTKRCPSNYWLWVFNYSTLSPALPTAVNTKSVKNRWSLRNCLVYKSALNESRVHALLHAPTGAVVAWRLMP